MVLLGLKAIPQMTNKFIAEPLGLVQRLPIMGLGHSHTCHYIMQVLMKGSYGKAFKAIRR